MAANLALLGYSDFGGGSILSQASSLGCTAGMANTLMPLVGGRGPNCAGKSLYSSINYAVGEGEKKENSFLLKTMSVML